MASNGTAAPPDMVVNHGSDSSSEAFTTGASRDSYFNPANPPRALREALRSMGSSGRTPSESPSEEDYDELSKTPPVIVLRRKRSESAPRPRGSGLREMSTGPETGGTPEDHDDDEKLGPKQNGEQKAKKKVTYGVAANDKELREILRAGMQRARQAEAGRGGSKGKFSDFVFTRKFSTFDRQNEAAANSPFHGFFTLFWIGLFLFIVKIGAENWRNTGSVLGTNEIMRSMFKKDVIVLLISDGVMCGLTGVSWVLQRLIYKGYIDWDRSGWILQNIWQTFFIGATIGWTQLRDWPWSHTVFFVLHGLVMLMKQHSYAFYNGYLSSAYKMRADLLAKLKQLDNVRPVQTPSRTQPSAAALSTSHLAYPPSAHEMKERRQSIHTGGDLGNSDLEMIAAAIESGEPLDEEQVHVFERIIKWEVDALSDELKGKSTRPEGAYPRNLTFKKHYEYIVLPTLVYELEYPRSERINWFYVAEKAAATFGVIFVMIMLSQAFIYPVVMRTVAMKEAGVPLPERFRAFPWMLSDLIFPFMMEYLLAWYVIWEAILNLLAELTFFADRTFYDAWWNSVSWDQFARDWNRPVHNFLLRHVYHSSISAMKVNKHTATLITFFLSACVHELVMYCIFKKLRGYLLMLQMFQLPLVRLSRTRWLKGRKTLGNVMFWFGIFTGPSILCSLYLIL
ncbi:O-acyltransferase [Pleurostoma richardsiae]|uniref:O-acyltransferase n=1 Tax=Pleurostoma richardsiae TaxID=41990 RepID=A0AA38VPZ8_9PEZI|nr:O-acyltransferase [Pleurostoma richardsiae]